MKKISAFLGLVALLVAELVFANAVATSVSGTAQVALGAAVPRPLRQGDIVRQGETVITGAGSSVVLKFDDGQVAALTSNSRMTITTYNYSAQSGTGNVLLSLINGGMRAITGLIGKNSPQTVSYRAATATIGIRGTDVTVVTFAGNVAVTVEDGTISFTFAGQTVTIPTGQGVRANPDGTFQVANAGQVISDLQRSPEGQQLRESFEGLRALQAFISAAVQLQRAGVVSEGATVGTPRPSGPTGGAGGGTASGR